MKKSVFIAALFFLFITTEAKAFVFTDLVAKVQRIQMIAQASQYIQQINNYRQEFDKYKKEFDNYFKSFHLVYRRLSQADWRDFVPTNWNRLRDHYITIWRTFDEAAWQAQVLGLRTSSLYSINPDYRTYADNLISLSEEQVDRLKKEESDLLELQKQDKEHNDDLERFKSRNAALTLGPDQVGNEIALSQQIALTNAILIEMASIQAETKLIEQRLLTDQREQRNLIMRMKQLEIEAENGNTRNFDYINSITKTQ
ncbi:MAG: hypothetical protein JXA73_03135 [Acidobacteria bacterium]|nr:hypothetical protein [Acidobacteriota bacterium]